MPLLSMPSRDAYQLLKSNKQAFWPNRSAQPNRVEPVCTPRMKASFKLAPNENIFAIGSCFARATEWHMRRLGYKFPGAAYRPRELDGRDPDGFINKFTPQSMLNEIRWALAPEEMPGEEAALFAMPDGTVVDNQLMTKIDVSPERAIERRREITQVFRGIKDCRVTIISLGHAEAWYDRKTGIYLTRPAPRPLTLAEPERYEVHVFDFDELYAATRRLMELILERGHPDGRIMLNVSPVPLLATFTDQDVLTANMYSKGALRTVAEQLAHEMDAVDYVPNFESAMLSDRRATWRDDLGHVTAYFVSLNAGMVGEAYANKEKNAAFARTFIRPPPGHPPGPPAEKAVAPGAAPKVPA